MNDKKRDTSAALRCIGFNIRRTDRVLTQYYDEVLAPSGLSAPQFGLLAVIAQVAPVTINHLAEVMDIDRTTLTRNLELLVSQRLLQTGEGEDRRMRLVMLTEEGEQALERAWPLWEQAHARIERALGRERFDALLNELATVRNLVE
jgi:DNA-binding MarR family transcriptional regulator